MDERLNEIQKAFNGKLVGNAKMKWYVAFVLSRMPDEIIQYVTENAWFMASMDDAWAFTFSGSDLQNKHLIFLSDELLAEKPSQIHWTIAHEIGHVMLGHKNRFFDKFSPEKVMQQEDEADAFAKRYIPLG